MPSRKSRACRRKKKQANSENGTASRRANDTRENNDKIHSSETRLVPKKHWKKLKLDACLLHDYSTENTTCSAQISAIDKPQEDDVNMTETPESNKEEFSSTITPAECPALVFKEDNPQDQMTSQQQRFVVQDKNQNFIQIPTKRTLENGRQVEVITCFPNVTVQELRNYRRPTTNRSPCPADTWDNKSFQSIAEQQPFATNKWIPQSGNLDTIGTNVRSRQFWGLQPGNNNGIIPESVRNPKPATITSAQAANQDNLFKVPRVPQKSFISKGNNASSQLAQPERVTSDPGNVNLGALGPFTPQVPFYPMGVGDKCKQDCPRCEARINGPKLEMHPAEKAKLRRNHGRTLLSKFNDKVKALYERQWFQRANSSQSGGDCSYFSDEYCLKEVAAYKRRLKNPTAVEVQAALDAGYNTNYGVPKQFIKVEKPWPLPKKGAVRYGDEPLPTQDELKKALMESLQEATLELPTAFYL